MLTTKNTNPATIRLRTEEQTAQLHALLLSAKDTARALSVSERTLYSLTQSGDLPCVRIGPRGIRYDLRDIESFIESRRQG